VVGLCKGSTLVYKMDATKKQGVDNAIEHPVKCKEAFS
jgi:hypothetical protein